MLDNQKDGKNMNNKNNLMNTRVGGFAEQCASAERTRNAASNFAQPARRERERERVNKRENSGAHTSARENAHTSANTSARATSAHAHFPKKALIAAAAAVLLIIAGAIFAIASTSAVQYDEYVPVKITQKLIKEDASAAKVTQDTYLTLEFEELDSTGASYSPAKTYLETFKVEKNASEVSKTVMLSVYKTYKITQVENQFSNWRYTQKTATFTNSTTDGGNDFWTPTGSGADANLPATLKLGTVDSPALGSRQVTLTQTLTTDTWLQDTADVLNTVDTTELYHITFDTNGHGSAVSSVNVQKGETIAAKKDEDAIKTEAKAADVDGLTLEGWYTDAACKTKFDLTSAVTSTMTLYANWVPATDGDALKYWISPSYKTTTANVTGKANVENTDNYVKEEWNVKKSYAEIQEDLKVLSDTAHENFTAAKYAEVYEEYESFMKNDDYHLYCKYSGTTTSDKDKYVEFRILQVGEHYAAGESDGSALTFEATNAISLKYRPRWQGSYNVGGWAASDLYKEMQQGGEIYSLFPETLQNDALTITKNSTSGGGTVTSPAEDLNGSAQSKFWVTSLSEIRGFTDFGYGREGDQYAYYKAIGVDANYAAANSNATLTTIPAMVNRALTRGEQTPENPNITAGYNGYLMMRTPRTTDSVDWTWQYGKELAYTATYITNSYSTTSAQNGVAPCFSLGGITGKRVQFDTQGHGTQVADQYIEAGGKAIDPTAQAGSSTGLTLEGWYNNSACKTSGSIGGVANKKWDFATDTISSATTLYANWVPTTQESTNNYWMAPASIKTTGNTAVGTDVNMSNEENYASPETHVTKSSEEIKNDVAAMKAGDAKVIAEYKGYMQTDSIHLYCKYNGATTKNVDDYLEFRIIQVGAHTANGTSDGTQLTFQAVRSMPLSYAPTAGSNAGGWPACQMYTALNSATGALYTKFPTGLRSDAASIAKYSTAGNASTALVSAASKFWPISVTELSGYTGAGYVSEGTQYDYYKSVAKIAVTGVNSSALTPVQPALINMHLTRNDAKPSNGSTTYFEYFSLRSPNTTSTGWSWVEKGGTIYHAHSSNNAWDSVLPCFAFSAPYTVTFNTQGHGNAVNSQFVQSGAKVTEPTAAEYGTEEGLKFEGWYSDSACTTKWDFANNTITKDTVLYANWVPDGDADKYWIAPASKITTGNTSTTAKQTNANYVAGAWNVKKSSAEIQADIAVLKRGNVSSNPTYATVLSEYQGFMNNDNYHLYTRYGTGSGSSEDDYVEFRIIQVGEHQIDATEGNNDSSALTFCAVHALPTRYIMNSTKTNVGGWGATDLCTTVNSTMLTDNTNYFRAGFASDLMNVEKAYNTGNGTGNATADYKLWLLSYTEACAVGATYDYVPGTSEEGKTYSWFSSKNVDASGWESPKNPSVAYPIGRSTAETGAYYTRSASKSSAYQFIIFDTNGALGGTKDATSDYRIIPAFAMGGYLVQFDTQGGSDVDAQLLKNKTTATKPADPVRDGYAFKGWYTDNTYATAFDFSQKIEEDTTVVAKWEAVSDSYWLNYAGATAPETGILKTRADIQNDLSVLKEGATNANYVNVLAEYTSYMNGVNGTASSEVHLYTKLNDGANTTGDAKNNYTEWRIIGLGEHESGDGVNITWQMTHVLPAAQQMNTTDTNVGGYAQSALHTKLAEGGSVYSMFNDAFLEDILAVEKTSGTGNKAAATATTTDKLWLLSAEEVYGATAVSSGSIATEGATQYAYYTNNSVTKSDATNECLAYRTRSGGLPANQSTEYGAYHEGDSTSTSETYASWWLRSPSAYSAQTFTRIYNDGRLDHNNASVMRGVALACSMQGVEYTIDKTKMQTALRALASTNPTTLKYVTGDSAELSGLTCVSAASDGIEAQGSGKIGVFQSSDATTLYIAPMDSSGVPAYNSKVMYAPEDSSAFLNAGSSYTNLSSCLTTIDCANLDTSRATKMNGMFFSNKSLSNLNISGFDTSKVTTMLDMFYNCQALTSIDVSNFDTQNTESMECMFQDCQTLTTITGLDSFNTAKVKSMSAMFERCYVLDSLDVSNFSGSSLTTASRMFQECKKITSLDLSNFATSSSLTNTSKMFNICNALTNITLPAGLNTSGVTNMSYMFNGCNSLLSIDATKFNTSSATNMECMFNGCKAFTALDVSGFDTRKVTTMSCLFGGCQSLTELDLSNFVTTSSLTDLSSMFQAAYNLKTIKFSSDFVTSGVTNMNTVFDQCSALTSLDLTYFNTTSVTSMNKMFGTCNNLQSITLGSSFDFVGTNGYLPTPSSTYITGADGNWYDTTTNNGYSPTDLATFHNALNEKRTYVAVPPTNYYWLAASGASNPSDTSGMLKTQSEIDEDMQVLHGTLSKTSAGKDKAAVTSEWEGYMTNNTHLYTAWNGTDTRSTGANKWVEFRIIQVGEHDGDGSAVTFMATHGLTQTGNLASSSSNTAGWSGSVLRTTLNSASGYLKTGLSDLVSSGKVKAVTKSAITKASGTWADGSTTDEFWIPSYSELFGKDVGYISSGSLMNEGSQYKWCETYITQPTGANANLSNTIKCRDGNDPVSFTTYYTWMRTPVISNTSCFAVLSSLGQASVDTYHTANRKYGIILCFAF